MIHRIAGKITRWSMITSEIEDDLEVVQYGIELFLETIIKYIILLFLGLLIHRFSVTAIALIIFAFIRASAGGKHANTNIGCTVLMTGVVMGGVVCNEFAKLSWQFAVVGGIVCFWIIYRYAPNGSEADFLLDRQARKEKKVYATKIFGVLFMIALSGWYRNLIMAVSIAAMILVFIEKNGKGGKHNEQKDIEEMHGC